MTSSGLCWLLLVGAAAPSEAPRPVLHGVVLEALPRAQEAGRFRLRATLDAVPARVNSREGGLVRMTATLAPKAATAAQCPVAGTVFFDGFDLP